jgi:hypothetical protein
MTLAHFSSPWNIAPVIDWLLREGRLNAEPGVPLLMTGTFAAVLGRPTRSLGSHRMRGLEEPVEVFVLAL